MKWCFQFMCFISLYLMVSCNRCRDALMQCTYRFPKKWHGTLRLESGWNDTNIQAICRYRFQLKYCTNTLQKVCTDRHSISFANGLFERLAYLCDEGREALRDASTCLKDRSYQLQSNSCYSMGRFYQEKLPEAERCDLALRYVGCFRNAAAKFCHKKAKRFIEKYNWISASYFVGCGRDWLSISSSYQVPTRGYFKTVLAAFAIGQFLQTLLIATPEKIQY